MTRGPGVWKFFLLSLLALSEVCLAGVEAQLSKPYAVEVNGVWRPRRKNPQISDFYLQLAIETPKALKKTKSGSDDTLMFKTRRLKGALRIPYRDGSREVLKYQIKVSDAPVIAQGCEEFGLNLQPTAPLKSEFYIGMRCEKKDDNVRVSISTPRGVTWDSTSIAETFGKGQSTRVFEINPNLTKAENSIIGEFNYLYRGQKFPFQLNLKYISLEKKTFVFAIGLGAASLSFEGTGFSSSEVKPMTLIWLQGRPFWPRLTLGAHLHSTFASPSPKLLKFSEILSYSGYSFNLGSSWLVEPRVYSLISEGSSKEGRSFYSFLALGGGLDLTYIFSRQSRLKTAVATTAGGSSSKLVISAHYIRYKISEIDEELPHWGIFLSTQTISVDADDQIDTSITSLGYTRFF